MLAKDFDRLAKDCFGSVLGPKGFTCAESRKSTFYRKVEGDIYHIIIADRYHHRPAYDVMVFASSPLIDTEFLSRFPDDLGIPSDTLCRLNVKSGIDTRGSEFPCGTAKAFRAAFDAVVASALSNVAVSYLDKIDTVEALLATIRHPYFKLVKA